jgi:hypothetical protein
MKLVTRMIAFLSFLIMVQNVEAAGNSVYMDQIGDGTTINITQTGNSNSIGSANAKATFNGNNNTVTIDQIGNGNITNTVINGTGVTVAKTITGNSNTTELNCGANGGSCSGSTITNTITGNGNSLTQNHDGLTNSTVTINSDNNTVNVTNTSTAIAGSKTNIDISGGNGNQVDITQSGAAGTAGHDTDLTIIGATNTVDIRQGGNVDSKVVTSITGSGNSVIIKSNHN